MKSISRAALLISTLLTASTAFGQSYLVAPAGSGESIFPARASIAEVAQSTAPSHKAWELSLIPLFGAQGLDAASSWGHIETNPLMAGSNGTFGAKAAGFKLAFVAGAQRLNTFSSRSTRAGRPCSSG